MARRLGLLSVLAVLVSVPLWVGRTDVEAAPKPVTAAACKADLGRAKQELASALAAVKRAEASEAEARAELERMRVAERARIKRLEAQTGVAADKLQ